MISHALLPESLVKLHLLQGDGSLEKDPNNLIEVIARTERRIILHALEKHAGNRTWAAKNLGISRPTRLMKMKKHKIEFERS